MQMELELGLNKQDLKMTKTRGFEVVSKYSEETLTRPSRATQGSAGYDLYNNTGADIVLAPGELSEAITTKYKSYMLQDEVLLILPRSGHGFKYSVRLANTTGVIDSDYYNNPKNEGEIFVKFHNQGTKELVIPKGEALGQAIFINYLLEDGDNFTTGNTREGGLGSTSGK